MANALITTIPSEWSPEDSLRLREFLGTLTGRRLANALLALAPAPYMIDDVSAKYTLGRVAGYSDAVQVLNTLADAELTLQRAATGTVDRAEAYPDLNDANAWPVELGGTKNSPVSVPPV